MKRSSSENPVFNLFDLKVRKFIAPQFYRFFYAFFLVFITLFVAVLEFYIARYFESSTLLKIVLGLAAPLLGILLLVVVRISLELYFAIFYIEEHLKSMRKITEANS